MSARLPNGRSQLSNNVFVSTYESIGPAIREFKKMTVSSRTPEGVPSRCILCGKDIQVEFSDPGNDATCPHCGHLIVKSAELLDQFQSFWERTRGVSIQAIDLPQQLLAMGNDSLEAVELVMQLEEEFGISVGEEESARIQTVGDAIRYILEKRQSG
ncbi:MAG: acyl carrier protein [Pirellula sp.]|jgi:acyl carrier protein